MIDKPLYDPNDDPVLPNYLALMACILHKELSVPRALALMGISVERGDRK